MSKKNKLTHAIIAIMSAAAGAPHAVAQNQEQNSGENPAMYEEVQVIGIRASLERAMDIKRDASGVVDAISAEDMGKFPDANLAESLQRIAGVTIDRNAGEGNTVTVRGLAADFNQVLVNGRQMPSSQDSRAFNFNDLASELVSGIQVYKSAVATQPSGGIGATININTARPLDIGEFRAVGTVKGVSDIEEGSVTPELSGMVSTTFADDTMGLLFAASHQVRKYEEERVAIDGWVRNPDFEDKIVNPEVNQTPNIFQPQNFNIGLEQVERERTNAALVFQFAPSDSLTATADLLYSELNNDLDISQFGVWFNSSNATSARINENGTIVEMYEEGTFDNISNHAETTSENTSFGVNVDWQVNDAFSMVFDANFAKSEENPNGEFNQYQAIVGYRNQQRFLLREGLDLPTVVDIYAANPARQQAPFCGDPGNGIVPNWTEQGYQNCLDYAAANGINPTQVVTGTGAEGEIAEDLLRVHRNDIQSTNTEDTINQFKLEGLIEDDNLTLTFGAMFTDQTKNNRIKYNAHEPRNVVEQFGGFYGFPVLSPEIVAGRMRIGSDFLDQFSGNESLPSEWVYFSPDAIFAEIWPTQGEGYTQIPYEWSPQSYEVQEETLATYLESEFDTDILDLPLNIQTGIRYEQTETTSTGFGQTLTELYFSDPTSLAARYAESEPVPVSETHDYSVLLPSLTAKLNVTEDIIARFAAYRSITRPDIDQLSPVININQTRPGGNLNASTGNPSLSPYLADNIDLGVEWYYADASYMSATYFRKHVNGYITTEVRSEPINGVLDPSTGTDPDGPDAGDVAGIFDISFPNNSGAADISGLELSVQHAFGETGFGAGANATFVSTNRELIPEDVDDRSAVPGLGDSANAMVYYERERFQTRLTYSWRDEFFQCFCQLQSGADAVIIDEYGQWDFSASYEVTDNITVLLEGINITSEGYRSHGRYDEQLYEALSTGARFALGVSARF